MSEHKPRKKIMDDSRTGYVPSRIIAGRKSRITARIVRLGLLELDSSDTTLFFTIEQLRSMVRNIFL